MQSVTVNDSLRDTVCDHAKMGLQALLAHFHNLPLSSFTHLKIVCAKRCADMQCIPTPPSQAASNIKAHAIMDIYTVPVAGHSASQFMIEP